MSGFMNSLRTGDIVGGLIFVLKYPQHGSRPLKARAGHLASSSPAQDRKERDKYGLSEREASEHGQQMMTAATLWPSTNLISPVFSRVVLLGKIVLLHEVYLAPVYRGMNRWQRWRQRKVGVGGWGEREREMDIT